MQILEHLPLSETNAHDFQQLEGNGNQVFVGHDQGSVGDNRAKTAGHSLEHEVFVPVVGAIGLAWRNDGKA